MSKIVVTTFELADGVTAKAFTEADERYQQDVAYQQPGLKRRTTATAAHSPTSWCIVETWAGDGSPVAWHTEALGSMVANVDRRTYETLD